ncbi:MULTISPECIES: hypothetical protein [unclassified Caballeronia]|nr:MULTISPECIES: hypothetical protein [unclassified Caballeronia]
MIGDAKARARFLRSGRDTAASAASEIRIGRRGISSAKARDSAST